MEEKVVFLVMTVKLVRWLAGTCVTANLMGPDWYLTAAYFAKSLALVVRVATSLILLVSNCEECGWVILQ